jgi:hypothetical protein
MAVSEGRIRTVRTTALGARPTGCAVVGDPACSLVDLSERSTFFRQRRPNGRRARRRHSCQRSQQTLKEGGILRLWSFDAALSGPKRSHSYRGIRPHLRPDGCRAPSRKRKVCPTICMSALCRYRTKCSAANSPSFDELVGANEERLRNR